MGINLNSKVDALLDLDEPPNLKRFNEDDTNPNGALRTALKEARHWYKAYCVAQKELIAIEDAQEIIKQAQKELIAIEDAQAILKRSRLTYWVYRTAILLSLLGNIWLYFR